MVQFQLNPPLRKHFKSTVKSVKQNRAEKFLISDFLTTYNKMYLTWHNELEREEE